MANGNANPQDIQAQDALIAATKARLTVHKAEADREAQWLAIPLCHRRFAYAKCCSLSNI